MTISTADVTWFKLLQCCLEQNSRDHARRHWIKTLSTKALNRINQCRWKAHLCETGRIWHDLRACPEGQALRLQHGSLLQTHKPARPHRELQSEGSSPRMQGFRHLVLSELQSWKIEWPTCQEMSEVNAQIYSNLRELRSLPSQTRGRLPNLFLEWLWLMRNTLHATTPWLVLILGPTQGLSWSCHVASHRGTVQGVI